MNIYKFLEIAAKRGIMELILLFKLTFVLIFGLLLVSFRRIPGVLLLVAFGFLLAYLNRFTGYSFTFPVEFLRPLALISLVAVVFSVYSRFNSHSLDHHSREASKHAFLFLFLSLIVLAGTYYYIFEDLVGAFIIPFLLIPVSLTRFFEKEKNHNSKVLDLLNNEQIITSAFAIIPLVIIGIYPFLQNHPLMAFLYPLLGISAGLVTGILFLRFRTHSRILPVLVLSGSILAYFLAYSMNASGVLAVASFAFLFSNIHVQNKQVVRRFIDNIADTFSVIAIIVLAITIFPRVNNEILTISCGFFVLLLLIRFVSVLFTQLNYMEKLFLILNCSHGRVVGVILFAVLTLTNTSLVPLQIATIVIMLSGVTTILSSLIKLPGVKKCR